VVWLARLADDIPDPGKHRTHSPYVTDELSITRILDHLGLSPLQQEKPPPAREVARCRWTTRGARSTLADSS